MVLNQNDLAVGETSHMHSATVPQETVIAQSPPPGDGLRVGQKVQLLVSMGPEQTVYAAPNLTGLTLPETAPVLQPLGCTIGKVTERDAPPGVVRGTVLDQSPAPGAPLQRGGTVDVVIARRL
jgi:beta-lactam-binding protein with PASTA domain